MVAMTTCRFREGAVRRPRAVISGFAGAFFEEGPEFDEGGVVYGRFSPFDAPSGAR